MVVEITQSTQTKVPIILDDVILRLGISSATCYITKQCTIPYIKTLTLNTNFFEVNNLSTPGLYQLLLSATDVDTVGSLIVTIKYNNGITDGYVNSEFTIVPVRQVDNYNYNDLIRKFARNRTLINSNVETIYEDNGSTANTAFTLTDNNNAGTMTNIWGKNPSSGFAQIITGFPLADRPTVISTTPPYIYNSIPNPYLGWHLSPAESPSFGSPFGTGTGAIDGELFQYTGNYGYRKAVFGDGLILPNQVPQINGRFGVTVPVSTSIFAACAWVKIKKITPGSQAIWGKWNNALPNFVSFGVFHNDQQQIYCKWTNTSNTTYNVSIPLNLYKFTIGKWFHIAISFNQSTNMMKFYIDGSLVYSTTTTDTGVTMTNSACFAGGGSAILYIGTGFSNRSGPGFIGNIDEILYYFTTEIDKSVWEQIYRKGMNYYSHYTFV